MQQPPLWPPCHHRSQQPSRIITTIVAKECSAPLPFNKPKATSAPLPPFRYPLQTLFADQRKQSTAQKELARTHGTKYSTNSFEHQYWQGITDRYAEQDQAFHSLEQDIKKLGTRKTPYTSEFY
jgi:hypothetical protein